MSSARETPRVSLLELFRVFFIIGAFSFGGGLIGWMHREVVGKRGWLTDDQFLSGLALGQVMPGANVTNMTVFIGQCVRGWTGAFVAIVAILTGPFFLVIAFASAYSDLIRIPGFHSAMDGIAAAAVGIVLSMGWSGARHSCRKWQQALVALAVFLAIGVMQWPLVYVVGVAAPVSVLIAWLQVRSHA